jgi:hypothetical protein
MKILEIRKVHLFFGFLFLLVAGFQSPGLCTEKQDLYGSENRSVVINFDQYPALPAGFRVETTRYSKHDAVWKVIKDKDAPSKPNVLKIAEIKDPSGSQFNICWSDKIRFRDGSIEVKVRADSGRIDQGGGPIWRVKDRMNYYVARMNPLEDNFRIYYVKDGNRIMLGSATVRGIREGQWFTIKIAVNDDHITGWVNGKKLIEVKDSTLPDEGGVGMWSKADAASSFDDLSVRMEE